MEPISLQLLARAAGDNAPHPGVVTQICTDTRQLTPGCLFVALQGERFDGHDFVPAALAGGAIAAVVHHPVKAPAKQLIQVEDTQRALLAMAACYRDQFPALRLTAVTGSVGKTTTKEMMACVLESAWKTLKTEGNLNNEIGMPKTLLQLDSSYGAAVIEMGMTGFGEIRDLAAAAKPCLGVITTIGVSHLERLGSRENILRAKLELAQELPDGAPLLLNGDNDLLSQVEENRLKTVFFGEENPACAIRCTAWREAGDSTWMTIAWEGNSYETRLPALGRHNRMNALAAFGTGVLLGLEPEQCARALAAYRPAGMRQRLVEKQGVLVMEDCYNASPDSMTAALETLGGYPCTGRRIAVLADMLELGAVQEEGHRQVGALAARKADLLLCWGELARLYLEGAREAGMEKAYWFKTKEELARAVAREAAPGDLVWFKASRGMALEEVIRLCWGD